MSQAASSSATEKAPGASYADSFGKSVLLIACLMVLQRGIGFLRSFYVCGVMSPEEVGRWDLGFSFLTLVAPLAVLGIPGSFGRYLARYESSGKQNEVLSKTLVACLVLASLTAGLILLGRNWIDDHFFGGLDDPRLIGLMAVGLPAVVLLNYCTCWFSGRRQNRLVFRIQFLQTLTFAVLCVFAFLFFAATANTVVACYLLSCLLAAILGLRYLTLPLQTDLQHAPSAGPAAPELSDESLWGKLLPFAVWVWISNTLMNLFSVCDRVLLVNYMDHTGETISFLIGQYHTACLFPALLMTAGAMAASTGMPFLSKDWESGDTSSVSNRLNQMMTAIGLICLAASASIQLVSPILFDGIWKGKFALGESLLPMALSYSSLAAMTLVAQKYFWCIERTWISGTFLFAGLASNFAIGVWLIGDYGIRGVVFSTLMAHALVLCGVLSVCRYKGWKIGSGVFYLAACLGCISLGLIPTLSCCVATLFLLTRTTRILSDSDRKHIASRIRSILPSPLLR